MIRPFGKTITSFFIAVFLSSIYVAAIQTAGDIDIAYMQTPYYMQDQNITLRFWVYNSTGSKLNINQSDCTIEIHNSTGSKLIDSTLQNDNDDFWYELDNTYTADMMIYNYYMECNTTAEMGFISNTFEVARFTNQESDVGGMPLAAIILLPMILGTFFIVGGVTLNAEEHAAAKIFLYILGLMTYFMSLLFGMQVIVRYYNFIELQDIIANNVYIIGLVMFFVISYFIIYLITIAIRKAAQDREARLEY